MCDEEDPNKSKVVASCDVKGIVPPTSDVHPALPRSGMESHVVVAAEIPVNLLPLPSFTNSYSFADLADRRRPTFYLNFDYILINAQMSFPAALRPAARSAYRDVLRAARVTFQQDPARHAQFVGAIRPTFMSSTLTDPSKPMVQPLEGPEVDFSAPEEVQKRINEWKEVADFLRKNVVQGRLEENGTYSESHRERVVRDDKWG